MQADDTYTEDPRKMADKWAKECEAADKETAPFRDASRKILQKYLDKRGTDSNALGLNTDGAFRLNLFWSTTQVLLSHLYAKRPKVDVSRANKDFDDDVARVAGSIVERILNNDIDKDNGDFDIATRSGIEQNLIVGMGQMWLLYEVETQPMRIDPLTGQPVPAEAAAPTEYATGTETGDVIPEAPLSDIDTTFEQITSEAVLTDFVHCDDFGWSPARTWEEVRWVSRTTRMTKEQLTARFGDEIAARVPLTLTKAKTGSVQVQNDPFPKGAVREIWCRETKRVYWWAKGVDVVLDSEADPLGLTNFFPCPRPLMANVTASHLMPLADYHFAQDQYELIDEMTTRAAYLTRAIKAVGVYDKTNDALKRVFQEASENQMIPVENWAAFSERGGIKGALDFIPVDAFSDALRNLNREIPAAKEALYEVLGVGDIMRGVTDPNETASAQELKAKFGSTRLELRQWAIAEWTAEASRIKAEIMVRHYQPATLLKQSAIEFTPDAPFAQQAVELLKGDTGDLPYRITIEADSMAAVDYAAMRDSRTQYLTSMGTFVQALSPLLTQRPETAPFMLEMLKWGLAGFKAGKQIESVLDRAIAAAQQPAPKEPDPAVEARAAKDKADAERAASQAVLNQANTEKVQVETQFLPLEVQSQAAADMARAMPFAPPQDGAGMGFPP